MVEDKKDWRIGLDVRPLTMDYALWWGMCKVMAIHEGWQQEGQDLGTVIEITDSSGLSKPSLVRAKYWEAVFPTGAIPFNDLGPDPNNPCCEIGPPSVYFEIPNREDSDIMAKTTIIAMRRRVVETATLLVDTGERVCLRDVTQGVERRGLGVADSFAAAVLREEGFTVQPEALASEIGEFVVQRNEGEHVE